MFIDAHAHIFNSGVIDNVGKRTEMTEKLSLEINTAYERIGIDKLENDLASANMDACLILPTASANNIETVNSKFLEIAANSRLIYTACTLHPDSNHNREELLRLNKNKIRAIKMCSFSQGFDLHGQNTIALLDLIRNENINNKTGLFLVLDTFYDAGRYFGTEPRFNTTPALFGELVRAYPEIIFVGAHMGGLNAPFRDIVKFLPHTGNFFMDTSNAAHTLKEEEFIQLLKIHGPEHIIYGTDWPWFGNSKEKVLISGLLDKAGYTKEHKELVFGNNMAKLLGIPE